MILGALVAGIIERPASGHEDELAVLTAAALVVALQHHTFPQINCEDFMTYGPSTQPIILFCADLLAPRTPDVAYLDEAAAADAAGLAHALISYEALVDDQDAARAVRRIPPAEAPTLAVYRGWMLRVDAYTTLYDALAAKNLFLINTPAQYQHTHHLPESYGVIAPVTPRTTWLATDGQIPMDQVMRCLEPFGDEPVIVKDYVKSRKHEWFEACFIPSASDWAQVERVVRRFIALQGADFTGGLVFREYRAFAPVGTHAQSGMPLTKEYRSFWLDGDLLALAPYWDNAMYTDDGPPVHAFRIIAQRVHSRCFTMDLAQTCDGDWLVVELGDGQVAGLPDLLDPTTWYETLAAHLRKRATTQTH